MDASIKFSGRETEEEKKRLIEQRRIHDLFTQFREKLINEGFFIKEASAQTIFFFGEWRVRIQRSYKQILVDKTGKRGFVSSLTKSIGWYDYPEFTHDDVNGLISTLLSVAMQPKLKARKQVNVDQNQTKAG